MLLSIAGTIPIGMFGLSILLLARDATASLAEAGRILGAFSLANAFGSVAQGRPSAARSSSRRPTTLRCLSRAPSRRAGLSWSACGTGH